MSDLQVAKRKLVLIECLYINFGLELLRKSNADVLIYIWPECMAPSMLKVTSDKDVAIILAYEQLRTSANYKNKEILNQEFYDQFDTIFHVGFDSYAIRTKHKGEMVEKPQWTKIPILPFTVSFNVYMEGLIKVSTKEPMKSHLVGYNLTGEKGKIEGKLTMRNRVSSYNHVTLTDGDSETIMRNMSILALRGNLTKNNDLVESLYKHLYQ